jgi:hypothetical protein
VICRMREDFEIGIEGEISADGELSYRSFAEK